MRDRSRSEAETVHITARVPTDLARELESIAKAEDRSVSAELRRIIRWHVEARQQSHPHAASA
jgi:predicted transcriptional regulator